MIYLVMYIAASFALHAAIEHEQKRRLDRHSMGRLADSYLRIIADYDTIDEEMYYYAG